MVTTGNDVVVVYNTRTFQLEGVVPVGKGVFHMWEGAGGRWWQRQLWVNNDVDNTTSVIDSRTLQTITTIQTPVDIVNAGGKPHDVWVSSFGRDAYVSYVGLSGNDDVVVQFDTTTFQETARAKVGKDPHLFLSARHVYVPSQVAGEVVVFERRGFSKTTAIKVPNAHGIWLAGRYLYLTNIAGGGKDGLVTIDTRSQAVVGTTEAPYAVPHNVVATRAGWWWKPGKLYVTHSGAASDKTSIYTYTRRNPVPKPAGDVTVGMNPFGLAVID